MRRVVKVSANGHPAYRSSAGGDWRRCFTSVRCRLPSTRRRLDALDGLETRRGFGATARVQDRVAQVWMPYDLYIANVWSHCGVDTFTLMKSEGRWRVAALIYTIEQPPACNRHPAGPPGTDPAPA